MVRSFPGGTDLDSISKVETKAGGETFDRGATPLTPSESCAVGYLLVFELS